jgi:hypothetical protein
MYFGTRTLLGKVFKVALESREFYSRSLLGFLGSSCSGSMFSAPIISVSMSVDLRGAKKLRVNITFGGSHSNF